MGHYLENHSIIIYNNSLLLKRIAEKEIYIICNKLWKAWYVVDSGFLYQTNPSTFSCDHQSHSTKHALWINFCISIIIFTFLIMSLHLILYVWFASIFLRSKRKVKLKVGRQLKPETAKCEFFFEITIQYAIAKTQYIHAGATLRLSLSSLVLGFSRLFYWVYSINNLSSDFVNQIFFKSLLLSRKVISKPGKQLNPRNM